MPRLRQSPQGAVAVLVGRGECGDVQPWRVVYVPPGVERNWLSQFLTDQAVAGWAVLEAREVTS